MPCTSYQQADQLAVLNQVVQARRRRAVVDEAILLADSVVLQLCRDAVAADEQVDVWETIASERGLCLCGYDDEGELISEKTCPLNARS